MADAIRLDKEILARGGTLFIDAPASRIPVPEYVLTEEDKAALTAALPGAPVENPQGEKPQSEKPTVESPKIDDQQLDNLSEERPPSVTAPSSVFGALAADEDNSTFELARNDIRIKSVGSAPAPPVFSEGFLGRNSGSTPPDTNGAVGPNHLVVAMNSGVTIQDKLGTQLSHVSLTSFWSPVPGVSDRFDPKVIYDPLAGRFIMVANANRRSAKSGVLLAVSTTSDPTGAWHQWLFDADSSNTKWADFPYIGITQDKITFTSNIFTFSDSFEGSNIWVADKSTALDGGAITTSLFFNSGKPAPAPALTYDAGETTQFMLTTFFPDFGGSGYLQMSTITGTASSPAFSLSTSYILGTNWNGTFVKAKQAGSTLKIKTNDDRIQNTVLRNGRLWGVHTVAPIGLSVTAAQWWEVNPFTSLTVQSGQVFDTGPLFFVYYPSIAANMDDEVLIGFSGSSVDVSVGSYYVQRNDSMPSGTTGPIMAVKEQTGLVMNKSRWGDYSATHVDPVDDTTMWTIQLIAGADNRYIAWWGKFGGAGTSPGDTTQPQVSGASVQDSATVRVTFDEAMAEDAALITPSFYQITGGAPSLTPTAVARVDATRVDLTVNEMGNGASYSVSVLQGPSDLSGNTVNSSNNSASFIGASQAPTVAMSSANPSSNNDDPNLVTVTFSEAITGFTLSDIDTSANATASNLSGSGSLYTFNLVPSSDGLLTADIGANAVVDATSNGNSPAIQFSRAFDGTAPVPSMSFNGGAPGLTNVASHAVTLTFGETSVVTFKKADLILSNATVSGYKNANNPTFTFNLVALSNGPVSARIAAGTVDDGVGNSNTASETISYTFDVSAPVVSMAFDDGNPGSTSTTTHPVTVSFTGGAVSGFTAGDIQTSGGSVSGFNSSANPTFTFDLVASSDGTVSASIAAGVATDSVGNLSTGSAAVSFSLDNTPPVPTVSFTNGNPGLTNDPTHAVTVSFNESTPVNFTKDDLSLTNATVTGFNAVANPTFTFILNGTSDGTAAVSVNAGAMTDAVGLANTQSDQVSFTYDKTAPALSMSFDSGAPGITAVASHAVTVTFSGGETVTGFTSSDISTTNGNISGFNASANPTFTFNLNAQSDGVVSASVAVGAAQDAAGNSSTGTSQRSFTYDSTAPVPTLSFNSGAPGATSTAAHAVTVTFGETEAVSFIQGDLSLTNATVTNFNASSNPTFTFTLTAVANGTVRALISGGAMADGVGNANTTTSQVEFEYDNVVPVPSMSFDSGAPGTTNTAIHAVTVTFGESDPVNFVQGDISLTNGSISGFNAASNPTFSFNLNATSDGAVSASIGAGAMTDGVGLANTASDQVSFTYDVTAPVPVLSFDGGDPGTTSTATHAVTLVFGEAEAVLFKKVGITLNNGIISNFDNGSNPIITFDITAASDGPVSATIAVGEVTDSVGLTNSTSSQIEFVFDSTVPVPAMSFDSGNPGTTNVPTHPVTVTFGETDPVNFLEGDITLVNASIEGGSFNATANPTFTFNLVATTAGTASAAINAGVMTDGVGLANVATATVFFPFDNDRPEIASITTNESRLIGDSPIPFEVIFEEAVTGFDVGDVGKPAGTIVSNFTTADNILYTFSLVPSVAIETQLVTIAAGVASDAAGNTNEFGDSLSVDFSTTQPTVQLKFTATDPGITSAATHGVTVTFNETVTDFVEGDISLANASIAASSFVDTNPTFTFDIVGASDGVVSASIASSVATDGDLNGNLPSNTLAFELDTVLPAPSLSFDGGAPGVTSVNSHAVTLTFGETNPVTFSSGSMVLTNATIANYDDSANPTFTFGLVAIGEGAVAVDIPATAVTDIALNSNTATDSLGFTFDSVPPVPAMAFDSGDPGDTTTDTHAVTVTFGETDPVTFVEGDVTLVNATIEAASFDAAANPTFTFNLVATGEGEASATIDAAKMTDAAGLANLSPATASFVYDITAPVPALTFVDGAPGITGIAAHRVMAIFGEANPVAFADTNIATSNATIENFDGSGNPVFFFDVVAVTDGPATATISAGSMSDAAGQANAASDSVAFTADLTSPIPTLTFDGGDPGTTNAGSQAITVMFGETNPVTFIESNLSLVNGIVANFNATSNPVFTFDLVATTDGLVSASIEAGTMSDGVGRPNASSAAASFVYDNTAPLPVMLFASGAPGVTNSPAHNVTLSFGEAAAVVFAEGDLVLSNATVSAFDGSANPVFSFNLTAVADGAVSASVAAGTAFDSVGLSNTEAASAGFTYDTTPPVATLAFDGGDPGTTNVAQQPVTLTFSGGEPVTEFDASDILVTAGAIESFDSSANPVFTFVLAARGEQGTVSAFLAAAVAQDAAGNTSEGSAELSFEFDSVPPLTAIEFTGGSTPGTTNVATQNVTVTFSDDVGVTAASLNEAGVAAANATVSNMDGTAAPTFTFDVTALGDGEVSISVPVGAVQDDAGNDNAASGPITFLYDSVGPVPVFTSESTDPTNVQPINVTLTFDEPVPGFAASAINTSNASVLDFASDGSGLVFTFVLEPTAEGSISASVSSGAVSDGAGNPNAEAVFTRLFTGDEPAVVLTSTSGAVTSDAVVSVTATFSETVTGFTADDVIVTNAGISNFLAVSGRVYTFDLTPNTEGTVTAMVPAGAVQDAVNNSNVASQSFAFTFDGSAPTLTLSSPEPPTTGAMDIAVNAQFSEPISGFTLSDITGTNATVSGLTMTSDSGDAFSFFLHPLATGPVSVTVPAGSVTDEAGIPSANTAEISFESDQTAPFVTRIDRLDPTPNSLSTVSFEVEFSEAVTGIDVEPEFTDFVLIITPEGSLPGTQITSISGSGNTYQVAVAVGFGSGSLRLDLLDDDSIKDGVAQPLEAADGSADGSFTGQTYTADRIIPMISVSGPNMPITTAGPVEFTVTYSDVATATLSGSDIVILAEEADILDRSGASVDPVATGTYLGTKGTSPPPFINVGAPVGTATVSNGSNPLEKVVTVSDISGDGFLSILVPGTTGATDDGANPFDAVSEAVVVDNTDPRIKTVEVDVDEDGSFDLPPDGIDRVDELFTLVGPEFTNENSADFNIVLTELVDFTEALIQLTGSLSGATTFTLTQADPNVAEYIVTATPNDPNADGTIGMTISPFADAAGNPFPGASSPGSFTFDNTSPAIAIVGPSVPGTVSGPVDYTVTYSDAIAVDLITLSPGTVELITTGTATAGISIITTNVEIANERVIRLSNVSGIGTLAARINAGTAQDTVGNVSSASATSAVVEIDSTPLVAGISMPSVSATISGPVTYDISYSGATQVTLSADDITLNRSGSANATVQVQGSGVTARQVVLSSIAGEGTISISIDGGTAVNAVNGTHDPFGPSFSFAVDKTGPTVEIAAPSMTATATQPVFFGVTFSGADQVGFGSQDVLLTQGGSASATPIVTRVNETQFNVTLDNISGEGTLAFSIPEGVASDSAGNLSAASGASATVLVDGTIPSVTVQQAATQADPAQEFPIFFDVNFSEPVTGFGPEDVELGGTFTTSQIDFTVSGSGSAYSVSIDQMPDTGAVAVFVAAGVATDPAANANTAYTSTDNIVFYTPPPCTLTSVTLTAPADGNTILVQVDDNKPPTPYTLVAETDCPDDTLEVAFYIDGVLLGTAAEPTYTYYIDNLKPFGKGEHIVTAVATSLTGGKATVEDSLTMTLVGSRARTNTSPGPATSSDEPRTGGKGQFDSGDGKAEGEIPVTLSFPSTDDPNVQVTVSASRSLLEEGETGTLIVLLGQSTGAVIGPDEADQLAREPSQGLVTGGEYVEVSIIISTDDGETFQEIPDERLLDNPVQFIIEGINVANGGFEQLYSHPTRVGDRVSDTEFDGIDVFAESGSWTTDHVQNLVVTEGAMHAELIGLSIFAPFKAEAGSGGKISVNPTTFDFGSVEVGSSAERNFTVSNSGAATLTGVVTVSAPFEAVSGVAYLLDPSESAIVSIRFTPTAAVGSSDMAEFSGGGGASSFLTGQGQTDVPPPGQVGCSSMGINAPFANYMGDLFLLVLATVWLAAYGRRSRKPVRYPG